MVQGHDPRFVNASVEFNTQTLQPTYRLMWGTAGASHALTVAEGLKFDPVVIADARSIISSQGSSMQSEARSERQVKEMQVRHAALCKLLVRKGACCASH